MPAPAANLDAIGVTLLRASTTNLNGAGIRVAQAEAGSPAWEVNPTATTLTAGAFTYYSSSGSAATYPNALGSESPHADGVGARLYGPGTGVATNVLHVDNYEASYFVSTVVFGQQAISAPLVNQSFAGSTSQQSSFDSPYDNYAATRGTLFVSAAGDSGPVVPPSTCYNGISVGAYQGASSTGPTPENGRAKPDLTAPEDATSDSCPLVTGAAALLLQAAARGDAGPSTAAAAADSRTVKAFLLNGAIKPADWTHPAPSPLDVRYGAGILNVFNSYQQLTGGKHAFIATTSASTGGAHAPPAVAGNVSTNSGWDFNTISSSVLNDGVNHYFFNLTNAPAIGGFTGTITLVWQRQSGQSSINDLNLYLYTASGALVQASTSAVDNVEHIFVTKLPPGRYDLQVLKSGGLGGKSVSTSETYGLAFEFFTETLGCARSGNGNVILTWPVYPAGFVLQSTANLKSPASWTIVNVTPVVSNRQNVVTLSATTGNQFFRLARP